MEPETNLERLVAADIMYANAELTNAQRDAINNLTEAEVDALISVKEKLASYFPLQGEAVSPVQHHS